MKALPSTSRRYDLVEASGEIMVKDNFQVSSFPPPPNWLESGKGLLVTFNGNNLQLNTADAYLVDVSSISNPL
jgi:hypothetical protein